MNLRRVDLSGWAQAVNRSEVLQYQLGRSRMLEYSSRVVTPARDIQISSSP